MNSKKNSETMRWRLSRLIKKKSETMRRGLRGPIEKSTVQRIDLNNVVTLLFLALYTRILTLSSLTRLLYFYLYIM